MAAIPVYLYFGNDMITGGAQPDTQLPTLWGFWLNNHKFNRVTPSAANGLNPPAPPGDFAPYWDGTLNGGNGTFCRFHHTRDFYIVDPTDPFTKAKGDNWFLPAGGGVTPCALLMAALWERYPTAPGFKLLKYAKAGAGYGSWKPGGAAWTEMMVQWTRFLAALDPGDSADVKHVILDCSTSDIVTGSSTFTVDAQASINAIKSTFGSSVKITIVNHPTDFYLPGGTAALSARQLHQGLKIANANVRLFDMSWARFGTDGPVGSVVVGPAQITYQTIDYLEAGARLARFQYQWDTGLDLSSGGGALEAHILIGDSNAITNGMDPSLVVLGGQQSLLGQPNTTERAGEWIWDAQNEQFVPYNVTGVTNSFGSFTQEFGPENTFLKRTKEYAEERPHNPDVGIFKFAAGGAQFYFVDSALPDIEAQWEKCKAAVYRDTGRTIDCRSVTIMIGRNDGMSEEGRAIFAARHVTFVDDVRRIFTTRSDGPELSVVWVQPSPHADTGIIGGTTGGSAEALTAVRDLIAELPTKRPRVRVLLDPDPDRPSRVRYEMQRVSAVPPVQLSVLHYGAEAVFAIGYDAAEAVRELNSEDATDEDDQVGGGEEPQVVVETPVDTSTAGRLAQIDAALSASGDVAGYETATGQRVQMRTITEMLALRRELAAQLARERGIRRTRAVFGA